jgi:hypothetical protein
MIFHLIKWSMLLQIPFNFLCPENRGGPFVLTTAQHIFMVLAFQIPDLPLHLISHFSYVLLKYARSVYKLSLGALRCSNRHAPSEPFIVQLCYVLQVQCAQQGNIGVISV